MKAKDIMTKDPRVVTPETTVQEAARLMQSEDTGVLPVVESSGSHRLIGMITDRDIAIRAVAEGLSPDSTCVSDVMTPDVDYCTDDQDVEEVLRQMGDKQLRRLPVIDAERRLVGIVSLGDLAAREGSDIDEAVRAISEPGGPGSTGG